MDKAILPSDFPFDVNPDNIEVIPEEQQPLHVMYTCSRHAHQCKFYNPKDFVEQYIRVYGAKTARAILINFSQKSLLYLTGLLEALSDQNLFPTDSQQ